MLIVQISDVHCGPEFKGEIFDTAVEEINSLDPDLIIVTGDLTENSLISQYRQAEANLKLLKAKARMVCSGNHDYRSTGYLIFKQIFPTKRIISLDNAVIILVGTARPDRDDGEVGHRQNIYLHRTLVRYRKKFKIVAMHHHVIPVPDTGADRITIIDAGDTLRTLTQNRANLLLCGHRHRPWRWNINDLTVIHAGTLSSERLRGFFSNSYNIIEIDRDEVNAKLKVVGGRKISFDQVVKVDQSIPSEF